MAARRGQEQPIGLSELRPLHLAAENLQLMTENESLHFPLVIEAMPNAQDAAQNEVNDREQHAISFGLKEGMLTALRGPGSWDF
jgi:hypothetical protein